MAIQFASYLQSQAAVAQFDSVEQEIKLEEILLKTKSEIEGKLRQNFLKVNLTQVNRQTNI